MSGSKTFADTEIYCLLAAKGASKVVGKGKGLKCKRSQQFNPPPLAGMKGNEEALLDAGMEGLLLIGHPFSVFFFCWVCMKEVSLQEMNSNGMMVPKLLFGAWLRNTAENCMTRRMVSPGMNSLTKSAESCMSAHICCCCVKIYGSRTSARLTRILVCRAYIGSFDLKKTGRQQDSQDRMSLQEQERKAAKIGGRQLVTMGAGGESGCGDWGQAHCPC